MAGRNVDGAMNEEAQHLLEPADLAVDEIAGQVGFAGELSVRHRVRRVDQAPAARRAELSFAGVATPAASFA